MSEPGHFYIVAAPSGAGKTSLVNALIQSLDHLKISISYTTRKQRPGEINDEHYHFITHEVFDEMVAEKKFLEHAEVFGHQYGTAREWVLRQLGKGVDVILEIDWQGARQIRQQFPSAVSIYILPPSTEELRRRLEKRAQDDPKTVSERMAQAKNEMVHYHEFDYILFNDDFDHALEDLQHIVLAKRLLCRVQKHNLANKLADLLETE